MQHVVPDFCFELISVVSKILHEDCYEVPPINIIFYLRLYRSVAFLAFLQVYTVSDVPAVL